MNRRQVLAAAGSIAVAGCLGRSGDSGSEPTPEECDVRPVVLSNGRDESVRVTLIYLTAAAEVAFTRLQEVRPSSEHRTYSSDSAPQFTRLAIVDGLGGQPDVTVECGEFPTEENLLVYFHPAGDIEIRNAQSGS